MSLDKLHRRDRNLAPTKEINELFRDKTFRKAGLNTNLSEEASAAQFEKLIVDGWNQYVTTGEIPESKENKGVTKIIDSMKNIPELSNKMINMEHTGMKMDRRTISTFWIESSGRELPEPTPKCDALLEDESIRLSLKEAGGSQLMSAGAGESLATFKSAERSLTESGRVSEEFLTSFKKLKSLLEDSLSKVDLEIEGHTKTELKYFLRELRSLKDEVDGGESNKTTKQLSALIKKHHLKSGILRRVQEIFSSLVSKDEKLKKDLQNEMNKFFSGNEAFKRFFVFEAASGYRKFNIPRPKANYFLIFNKAGTILEVEKIGDSIDDIGSYLDKILPTVKIRPRWKHDQPAIAADVPKPKKEKNIKEETLLIDIIAESYNEIEASILQEGWIGELITKHDPAAVLGSYVKKAYQFLKDLVTRIIDYLSKLIDDGIAAVYEFLGFEVEDVDVEINFKF
jgi:hypothetical protein